MVILTLTCLAEEILSMEIKELKTQDTIGV